MTHLLAVIGDPVSHSLSPLIHNQWLRDHGIDGRYMGLEIKADNLAAALADLHSRSFRGLNVTLPHKRAALACATTASGLARRLGAANTLVRSEEGWRAENTDAPGFSMTLDFADIDVAGKRTVVLGAGGSARAIVDVLASRGADLVIINRTAEHAETLARELAPAATLAPIERMQSVLACADLVINTLSIGHIGADFALPAACPGSIYYDISYGRAAQGGLAAARAAGWRSLDGLGMLVAQAALSFELWFGVQPDMAGAHARARKVLEATQ